jgi:MerR family redox-sensitive transcriptional activator SoxR
LDQLEKCLTIGQVARRAGVASSSIRYYESIGLLPAADRESGQRRYDESVLRKLEMIGVAQKAGFSLREIKELMSGAEDGAEIATAMQPLAKRKLTQVSAMLKQAQLMKKWLELASDCDCKSPDECSLFDESAAGIDQLRVVRVPGKDGKPSCRKNAVA